MQKKSIGMCILFSIITCGIYGIYWFVTLTDDLKQLSGDNQTASGGMAILLEIVTCNIYGWYWAYKRGENIDTAKNMRGLQGGNSGILFIVLQALGLSIINSAIMQDNINKMIDMDMMNRQNQFNQNQFNNPNQF